MNKHNTSVMKYLVPLAILAGLGGACVYENFAHDAVDTSGPKTNNAVVAENFANKIEQISGQKLDVNTKSMIVQHISGTDLNAIVYNGYKYVTNYDSSLIMLATQSGVSVLQENDGKFSEFFTDHLVKSLASDIFRSVKDTIDFKATNEKAVVVLYIDPYCGYCALALKNIEQYNKEGITVRVAARPMFNDPERNSMETAARIWAAKDPKAALLEHEANYAAFRNGDHSKPFTENLPAATEKSKAVIAAQLETVKPLSNVGVPIFVSKDTVINGYVSADKLAELLKISAPAKTASVSAAVKA